MIFAPPGTLVTGSYDGVILVTQLETWHVIHTLEPEGKGSVEKRKINNYAVIYLKPLAALLSVGSEGILRIWDIVLGSLIAEIDCKLDRLEGIFAMVCNAHSNIIYMGDASGRVTTWSINSNHEVAHIKSLQAHTRAITALLLIESMGLLVTASEDCSIRLFTVTLF